MTIIPDHPTFDGFAPPVTKKHTGPLNGAADYLKAQYINRWGIVNVAKQQSIAEHSFNVWVLVTHWGPECLNLQELRCAQELALMHDLAEIRTGDFPTSFKDPLIKEALGEMEKEICPQIPATPRIKQLVKFCDTAESVLFLKLYGIGKHANDVQELLAVQMRDRLKDSLFSTNQRQKLYDFFNECFHEL